MTKKFVPLVALALFGLMFAPAVFQSEVAAQDTVTPQNLTGMLSELPAIINQIGATFTSIVQAFTSQQGLSLLVRNCGRAAMTGLTAGLGSLTRITYYTLYGALLGFLFPVPIICAPITVPLLGIVAFIASLVAHVIQWIANVLTALLQNY